MNNQLIEKVIKFHDNNGCPKFSFENPLLDPIVAKACARSFVKSLSILQKDFNKHINHRQPILEHIRKVCRIETEIHQEIDDSAKNMLAEVYLKSIEQKLPKKATDRDLDDFLVKNLKEFDVNSKQKSNLNPEIMQSLINLNPSHIELFSKELLHMDTHRNKNITVLRNLWEKDCLDCDIVRDLSIKMKSDIEIQLLNTSHKILLEDAYNVMDDKNMKVLLEKSSKAPELFQTCCKILNYLLIKTGFNDKILKFVEEFINCIKILNSQIFSLYPSNLRHVALLMDINFDKLIDYKSNYINKTNSHLQLLEETDLIMLLSHFPCWFDLYHN